jgi:hypothetical protein
MNLGLIAKGAKEFGGILLENSPTILTGLAVGGVLSTGVLAWNAANNAQILVINEQEIRDIELENKGHHAPLMSPKEIFLLTWKCYIPTVAMGAATIACIIGANSINLRRNAILAGAYTLTETALKEYQEKVKEIVGEKKERAIRDEISQDHLNRTPVVDDMVIVTGTGDTLCFDALSGRYFYGNLENLRKIQNDFNYTLMQEMDIPLNDLYDAIGIERTEMGRNMGWKLESGQLAINFSSKIATNGKPCIVLSYPVVPRKL